METKNEPAQLAVQQTTQAQVPVSQPVILSPGQQLVYPPGQAVPVAGQPMYVQAVPGQPPMQYQMPASGQAPPGQNAPGQQPVQYQMPAGGWWLYGPIPTRTSGVHAAAAAARIQFDHGLQLHQVTAGDIQVH